MIPAPTISGRQAAVARGSLAILGEHLLAMHSATDLDTVFTSATAALERLVSCDWASVSYSPSGLGGQRRFWSRHRADQERVSGPAREFYDQHPLWLEWQRTLSDRPAHMDRVISDGDLERRDIYHTVLKPLGIRRMLGSCMPDGIDVAFAMCRDSTAAFSDDDAALLDLISRHLALSVKRLRDSGKGSAYVRGRLEPVSEYGLVALNAVKRLMSDSSAGLMTNFASFVKTQATSNGGIIRSKSETISDRIEIYDQTIERENTRVANEERKLRAQFAAMEKATSQLQGSVPQLLGDLSN